MEPDALGQAEEAATGMPREEGCIDHKEFVRQVQQRAHLSSRARAEAITVATLTTLAEQTGGKEVAALVRWLPRGLAASLRNTPPAVPSAYTSTLSHFLQRVAVAADGDLSDAVHYTRAVTAVLSRVLPEQEMAALLAALPSDFELLFLFGRHARLAAPWRRTLSRHTA